MEGVNKMGKTRKLNANRAGYALLFMIVAMVVLLAAGVGLLQLGLRGRIRATRNTEQISAPCAADAGLTARDALAYVESPTEEPKRAEADVADASSQPRSGDPVAS